MILYFWALRLEHAKLGPLALSSEKSAIGRDERLNIGVLLGLGLHLRHLAAQLGVIGTALVPVVGRGRLKQLGLPGLGAFLLGSALEGHGSLGSLTVLWLRCGRTYG